MTKRDDYVIMVNKKEMYSNQPGEKKKKNTIQENDSEDRVGRRIWKTVCTRDGKFSSPGFLPHEKTGEVGIDYGWN